MMHSSPPSAAAGAAPFVHLFLWAAALGALWHVVGSSRGSAALDSADWGEHHALVPSEVLRSSPPWQLRAYETVREGLSPAQKTMQSSLCRRPFMPVQVDNPYQSENQFGFVKRSYICLRFDKGRCRGQDMEELWNRRYYKKYDTYDGTFLMTDTTALNRLKRDDRETFDKIMFKAEGESYISALDGGDAISGNKAKQLETKRSYTEQFGCDYNDLRLQPAQFTMHKPKECRAFFKYADAHAGKMWIQKPILGQGGVGITLHTAGADFEHLRACRKPKKDDKVSDEVVEEEPEGKASKYKADAARPKDPEDNKYIIQDYIQKPLLIHGKKFDMRVYMLIASAMPYIVFYHPGYLRRSVSKYVERDTNETNFLTNTHYQSLVENFVLKDHIWGFPRLQKYLSDNNIAGSQYVSTVLNSAIKKGLVFNFMSARDQLHRRKGSYHLFGLDFMIDEQMGVHFIEANGYPGYTWSPDYPTRTLVTHMFDMLIELHESPTAFERMTQGDMYGSFELIYNEMEDDCSEKLYNPCVEFASFNRVPMKDMAAQIGTIHDSGRRTRFRANQKVKTDAKRALQVCVDAGMDTKSPDCSRAMKQDRRQKFAKTFREIAEWQLINVFVSGM